MMQTITLIGIDFGLRNIGLAVGQTLTHTASPLKTIKFSEPFQWAELDSIVKQWQPQKFILGLPLTEGGEEQEITRAVRKFGQMLTDRYQLELEFVDERYSSLQAQAEFANARSMGLAKRKDSHNMDSYAARNILQRWLDLHS